MSADRTPNRRLWRRVALYALLTFVALVTLFPFAWSLYASFIRNDIDLNVFPPPDGALGPDNYAFMVTEGRMLRWYWNSFFVTTTITVVNLLINSMAAFSLARTRLPGRKLLMLGVIGLMMVPPQVLLIPIYILVIQLGWFNSYWALIVPFLASPFGIFLMHQFFVSLPRDIEEAAAIDGLSVMGVFFRIALPLSGPALAAQAIFLFVWNWNNFAYPSIVQSTPEMFTLPVAIYQMTHTTYSNQIAKSMAGIVMALVPVVTAYFVLQRRFIEGIARTGVKG